MLAQDHVHSAGLDSIQPQRSKIGKWGFFLIKRTSCFVECIALVIATPRPPASVNTSIPSQYHGTELPSGTLLKGATFWNSPYNTIRHHTNYMGEPYTSTTIKLYCIPCALKVNRIAYLSSLALYD